MREPSLGIRRCAIAKWPHTPHRAGAGLTSAPYGPVTAAAAERPSGSAASGSCWQAMEPVPRLPGRGCPRTGDAQRPVPRRRRTAGAVRRWLHSRCQTRRAVAGVGRVSAVVARTSLNPFLPSRQPNKKGRCHHRVWWPHRTAGRRRAGPRGHSCRPPHPSCRGRPGVWPRGGTFSETRAAADLHTGRTPALRSDVSAPDRCALLVAFRLPCLSLMGSALAHGVSRHPLGRLT
jgi:hypothetical protein